MIVIFDLDGTLADISHRLHFIQQEDKDWPGFFGACFDDKVIENTAEVFRALKEAGHKIWIITGRSDESERDTVSWLYFNDLEFDKLIMRKAGDHQPDTKLKQSLLKKHFPISVKEILCVFEDRSSVVDMWRENGLICYQVAQGDF